MPHPIPPDTAAQLLEALATHEYFIRKYRTRGDARADQGNHRSSTEYHLLASQESAKRTHIVAQLVALLGPDGGPNLPVAGVLAAATRQAAALAAVDDQSSFEDACFLRRHPRWAQMIDKYTQANRRWAGTAALEAVAPGCHPIWISWTD
jgi:hypothetical protein